jgi:hypothetical protein
MDVLHAGNPEFFLLVATTPNHRLSGTGIHNWVVTLSGPSVVFADKPTLSIQAGLMRLRLSDICRKATISLSYRQVSLRQSRTSILSHLLLRWHLLSRVTKNTWPSNTSNNMPSTAFQEHTIPTYGAT